MMDPLYRRLLGDRFDILPAPIRRMHDRPGAMIAKGSCEVAWERRFWVLTWSISGEVSTE